MKRLFLDTNILLDLIADRQPFSKFAIAIFSQAEQGQLELYTSSHAMATTHYLLKKYLDDMKLRQVLKNLMDYVQIVSVDKASLLDAIDSPHPDFEDAVQIGCAKTVIHLDYIITRNKKDFSQSTIAVLSPDEFFLSS